MGALLVKVTSAALNCEHAHNQSHHSIFFKNILRKYNPNFYSQGTKRRYYVKLSRLGFVLDAGKLVDELLVV